MQNNNGNFQIYKENDLAKGGILLKTSGGMDISSGDLNINNGDLYVKGQRTNNVKINFTPSFTKDISTNKFIYDIDLNPYIPNITENNVKVFKLYAWHPQTDISNNINNIYSGAYIFYIINSPNLLQRKHIIHEIGGGATFNILNNNTLRFLGDTNKPVSVVLNLLS
jgi:hypothetical protein